MFNLNDMKHVFVILNVLLNIYHLAEGAVSDGPSEPVLVKFHRMRKEPFALEGSDFLGLGYNQLYGNPLGESDAFNVDPVRLSYTENVVNHSLTPSTFK